MAPRWFSTRYSLRARLPVVAVTVYFLWSLVTSPGTVSSGQGSAGRLIKRTHWHTPWSKCRADMEVNTLPPMSDNYTRMMQDFLNYLTKPNNRACQKLLRFGGKEEITAPERPPTMDGHKYVCADPEFSILSTDQCLIYSFGISTEWSFDWRMKSLGCHVYAFDPSINKTSGSRNGTITFLLFGISDDNVRNEAGWDMRTLDFLVNHRHHNERTIQYLKMDVEGSELPVLRQQLSDMRDSVLFKNVEQLAMELHFSWDPAMFREWYKSAYHTLLGLQELGFYPFHYEPNLGRYHRWDIPGTDEKLDWAIEVVWLKTRCV